MIEKSFWSHLNKTVWKVSWYSYNHGIIMGFKFNIELNYPKNVYVVLCRVRAINPH